MNYATTNKLLKKGVPRTVIGQVVWAVLILCLLAPASYLFGFFKSRERAANMPYEEIMSQTAQRPPENIAAPESISAMLQPFGTTNVESSLMGSRRIWRAEYEVNRHKSDAQLFSQISRVWKRNGLRVETTDKTISGFDRRSEMLFLGSRNGDEQFVIFAYEKSSADVASMDTDAMFRANELPLPPRGAEVIESSGPGAGNISAFKVRRGGYKAAMYYVEDMRQMGWEDITTLDESQQMVPATETLAMMKKGDRHATVTTMATSRGEQIISLVIF
ncbi:hypothetical protein IT570_11370 [Candidatus Sumerlaeota bacterium]|nr:hypothetical protein [Candidatus Sumerlaeota bacterium]